MKKFSILFCLLIVNTIGYSSPDEEAEPIPISKIRQLSSRSVQIAVQHPYKSGSVFEELGDDFDFSLPDSENSIAGLIFDYNHNDILIGRYGECYDHPGNSEFWELVGSYRDDYKHASKRMKEALSWNILATIKVRGSRFLKYIPSKAAWKQMSNSQAKIKIRKTLGGTGFSKKVREPVKSISLQSDVEYKPSSDEQVQGNYNEFCSSSSAVSTNFYSNFDFDILMGRGGKYCKHPGNLEFRKWVVTYRTHYLGLSKKEKTMLKNQLLGFIKARGVRFLKYNSAKDVWFEVSDEKAKEKIAQTLRDGIVYFDELHEQD
ncbi:MAG: hypothetical protein AB8G05_25330 [Oligoflexales bacterium]